MNPDSSDSAPSDTTAEAPAEISPELKSEMEAIAGGPIPSLPPTPPKAARFGAARGNINGRKPGQLSRAPGAVPARKLSGAFATPPDAVLRNRERIEKANKKLAALITAFDTQSAEIRQIIADTVGSYGGAEEMTRLGFDHVEVLSFLDAVNAAISEVED